MSHTLHPLSPEAIAVLNTLACEIDISTITIGDRIRKDFSHVPDLAKSIAADGLIQPIVLTHDNRLIAGESRIRAHLLLGRTTIRAVYRGVVDDAQLGILESAENVERKSLTWQERVLSIEKVHSYKSTSAALRGNSWGVRETGRLLGLGKSSISNATLVAECLHANDEEVWKCETLKDALKVLILREEQEAAKLLVTQSIPRGAAGYTTDRTVTLTPTIPLPSRILPEDVPDSDFFTPARETFTPGISSPITTDEHPGQLSSTPTPSPVLSRIPLSHILLREPSYDTLHCLESLGQSCTDHIVTDPPYGISMANIDQSNTGSDMSLVAAEHDADKNLDLLVRFLPLAYRAIRDRGFLVMWCDFDHWEFLKTQAGAAGFAVQRWPLVWHKTSACSNGAASYNFTKNTEIALVARKRNATLISHQKSSVWTGGNDTETRLLGHPFAKPFGLWEWIYSAIALRGAEVLDPFAGSCSSLIPALRLGLRPRGIESNEGHYNTGLTNLMNTYKSLDPTCTFE